MLRSIAFSIEKKFPRASARDQAYKSYVIVIISESEFIYLF